MSEEAQTPAGEDGQSNAGFETLLERLDAVVQRLEKGDLSLEDALSDFEQGMGLVERAEGVLKEAEQRVQKVVEARDGAIEEVPFKG